MAALVNICAPVAKSRTIDGLPCILVEKATENAAGLPSESQTIAVFRDDEIGNELADDLVDRINRNRVRI